MVQTPVKQPENQANKASAAKSNFFGGGSGASFFQAKLTVNQPGDKYEVEADAVADRVVGMPNHHGGEGQTQTAGLSPIQRLSVQRQEEKEEAVQAKLTQDTLQRKQEEEQEEANIQRAEQEKEEESIQRVEDKKEEGDVQMKESDEKEDEQVQRVEAIPNKEEEQGPEDKVQAKESEERKNLTLQKQGSEANAHENQAPNIVKNQNQATETKPILGTEPELPKPKVPAPAPVASKSVKVKSINTEEEAVQAKSNSHAGTTPSADFSAQLNSSKGVGSPLPSPIQTEMESGIGADFSSVRVHTDHQAANMSREINAKAFTHGRDIYFNEGQYNPATNSGKHLLAHELTHTVQQGAASEIKPKNEEPASVVQLEGSPESAVDFKDRSNDDHTNNQPEQLKESIPPELQIEEEITDIPPDPVETSIDPIEPEVSAAELNLDDAAFNQPEDAPEEVEEVQAVEHSGNSDKMAKSVATASASQMAASYGGLGDALSSRLNEETQETAAETPQLHAKNTGAKEQLLGSQIKVSATSDAAIGNGVTSANPGAIHLPEHQDRGEAPDNAGAKERQIDAKGEENFFEWVKNKPSNLFGNIQTKDNNINTNAGPRPKFDRKGDADPERSKNNRKDGDAQSAGAQSENAQAIANNNGQQRIVPVFVDQKQTVVLSNEPEPLKTEDSQAAADYVSAPLPANIRAAADAKLAAKLQPKLDKANQDIDAAATSKNTEKKAATEDHQKQVEELNEQATKEQVDAVKSNRKAVADQQKEGVKESAAMLQDYRKDADKEQTQADKDVHERITTDEQQSDKELKSGEEKAEAERKRGEVEAAEVKRKREEEAKDDSWWGSFKRAVKSVVKAITSAIDAVFNAVRKAVKGLIEAAKKAALAVIEAGRKWIVDKLNKFRDVLKGMVNKLLANFPALRDKVNAFIDKTVDAAIDTVNKAADLLKKGVEALANALGKVLDKILSVFQTALKAAVAIVGAVVTGDFAEALRIAIEAACEIAGIDPKPVFDFFDRAGKAIMKILKAPLTFIKNVGKGIGGGFQLFWKNITENLKAGVIAWLTGSMKETPLKLPETWDVKGIFSVVAQLVGLTLENIKAKFIKAMGPKGAAIWAKVEKTAEFAQKVGKLVTQGPAAIWEFAKDAVGNIKEVVLTAIRNWLSLEVIKQGIIWLLSLTNPASALAKAVKMLFDVAMFLVNRFNQIKDFVLAVYEMISDMVAGNVGKIVTAVENVLKRLIPLVIGLIAAVLSLGSLADKVTGIIKKFTIPIERVIMKIVRWLVKKAKTMVKKVGGFVKDKAGKLVEWWKAKKQFKDSKGATHALYLKKSGSSYTLMIASREKQFGDFLNSINVDQDNDSHKSAYRKAKEIAADIQNFTNKKQRTSRNEKNEKDISFEFAQKLEALGEAVAVFMNFDGQNTPVSGMPRFGGLTVNGHFGTSMRIKPLTSVGVTGTAVSVENEASIKLNKRRSGSGSYYVLGHLLSQKLHGAGYDWQNLTPLTRKANKEHEEKIESKLKYGISEGKIYEYAVNMNYGQHRGKAIQAQVDSEIEQLLQEKQTKANQEKLKRLKTIKLILEAERVVAISLTFEAQEFDKEGKPIGSLMTDRVENKLGRTISDYQVSKEE